MSNNELYEHKRSDTVKWVISFFLILVLLVGMVGTWVFLLREDEGKTPPAEEEQTEQAAVTDGEGNAMDADMVYPMPAKMSFNAQTFAQFGEPNAVTSEQSVDVRIQAYVTPDDAANKEVDFLRGLGQRSHARQRACHELSHRDARFGRQHDGDRILQKGVRR